MQKILWKNPLILTVFAIISVQSGRTEGTAEQITVVGSNLRHSCNANKPSDSQEVWKREGGLLFSDGTPEYEDAFLEIENLQREDAGVYVCHTEGVLRSTVEVLVQYSPFLLPLIGPSKSNKSTVSIACVAEGFPPPRIHWSWNETAEDVITEAFERDVSFFEELLSVSLKKAEMSGKYELNETEGYEELQIPLSSRFVASLLTLRNTSESLSLPKDLTCTAINILGSARMLVDEDPKEKEHRRSSPVAFVIAMLPPIHIGFYIICVLACKSGLSEHSPWTVVKEGWADSQDD